MSGATGRARRAIDADACSPLSDESLSLAARLGEDVLVLDAELEATRRFGITQQEVIKELKARAEAAERESAYLLREINLMRRVMQDAGTWDKFCVDYARYRRKRAELAGEETTVLSRDDRVMLEAWLVGADFPMADVARRLVAALRSAEDRLQQIYEIAHEADGYMNCNGELDDIERIAKGS